MPTIIPVRAVARNRIFAFMSGGKPAALDSINILPPSAKVFSPAHRTSDDIDGLKLLITIFGAGLLVSLLFATYGVDLSPGFF
jgi:hypothetical protein